MKILYSDVMRIYDKNKSLIHKIDKNERKIQTSVAVLSQTAKFTAIVCKM